MLEKMAEFFEARLEGYDEHMLNEIEDAQKFYSFTASHLPSNANAEILDLGCGTGLELEFYFNLNPNAAVTGIDLSQGMLSRLRQKMPDRNLTLIHGSYFDKQFETSKYHAVVSVESLHHFTQKQKTNLYQKVHSALQPGGYFLLTDYFANSTEEEVFFYNELLRLKQENHIADQDFYHYDTPLTVEHEIQALYEAGFKHVEELNHWGATHTLKAYK